MQNVDEKCKEYSISQDAECNWELFFGKNEQFSDEENIFQSENMIKNLQFTKKINNFVPSLNREKMLCHSRNFKTFKLKEIKFPELGTLNASQDHTEKKDKKQTGILNQEKITKSIRKLESSDSEDFHTPVKKRKKSSEIHSINNFSTTDKDFTQRSLPLNTRSQENDKIEIMRIPLQEASKSLSDSMTISSQGTLGSQMASISSQESCGSKMITSSQEISGSQKDLTGQKLTNSSQENSISQNIISSQESCSPKIIASSQESLGNQVMNISIEEDSSHISKPESHSSLETQMIIAPFIISRCQQTLTHEEIKQSNYVDQSITPKLKMYDQQRLGRNTFSSKKKQLDFGNKSKFTECVSSSISDSFCNQSYKRHNRAEKRIIWNIRKRELEVTKREDVVEIRKKLLDAREAALLKREQILNAREQKYLRLKVNMKKMFEKKTSNSKKIKKRRLVS